MTAAARAASEALGEAAAPPRRHRLALAAIAAQVGVEMRTRLRSTGTIVTVLVLFAAAFGYVPPPGSNRVSIMWKTGGEMVSGTYTVGFIGAIVAMLTAMLLPLVGFYLVSGSVRRDLERRVWPILAATPTSTASYLLGKWLAAVAYLMVLAAIGLVPAVILFVQHGTGEFAVGQLLLPWLLMAPPAMLFTAAMALLFDVTPGLRGRGGYVVWFFAWAFLFMMIPGNLGNMLDNDPDNDRLTSYDPAGLVLFDHLIEASAQTPVESVSMGVVILDEPVRRVPFPPLRPDGKLVAMRFAAAAWTAVPLGLAIALFARTRRTAGRSLRRGRAAAAAMALPLDAAGAAATPAGPLALRAHPTRPRLSRSVLAELILTWRAASWLKWPLVGCALAALVVPGDARGAFTAVFLLLLAPPIAEAAAREQLAGTAAVSLAQPGVPRSVVGWKAAAVGLFVLLAGAPVLAAAFLRSTEHGVAMALALAFLAAAAVGLGYLSGGGKLFLGAYTALWYVAIQRDSPLDFSGAFTAPDAGRSAAFAGVGLLALGGAAVVERVRAARS